MDYSEGNITLRWTSTQCNAIYFMRIYESILKSKNHHRSMDSCRIYVANRKFFLSGTWRMFLPASSRREALAP